MGKERLTKLKSDVTEHQKKTRQFVDKYLGDEKLWWHMEGDKGKKDGHSSSLSPYWISKDDRRNTENMPTLFSEPFAYVAGSLGTILRQYGYIQEGREGVNSVYPVWQKPMQGHYYSGSIRFLRIPFTSKIGRRVEAVY